MTRTCHRDGCTEEFPDEEDDIALEYERHLAVDHIDPWDEPGYPSPA